jgi:hypothetical protein
MFRRFVFSLCLFVSVASQAETPIAVVHRLTDAIRKGEKALIAPFYLTLKDRPLDLSWIMLVGS